MEVSLWKRIKMLFIHTRKRIKCFPSTLRRKNVKTQQPQAAETLECTREHVHSKVLVEPMWRNQHGNHNFGRHWGRLRQTKHLIIMTSSFKKSFVFKMFSVHTKTKSSISKFLCFQECLWEAPFSEDNFSGLEWMKGLTREIKLHFQIPPA